MGEHGTETAATIPTEGQNDVHTRKQKQLKPMGKVDRRALPKPDRTRRGADTSYLAPSTPMERCLAELWQELIDVERVGVHDNFFDLGGHSLLAMKVVSRLDERTGIRLNPGELILQNLGQLGAACEQLVPGKPGTAMTPGLTGRLRDVFARVLRRRGT